MDFKYRLSMKRRWDRFTFTFPTLAKIRDFMETFFTTVDPDPDHPDEKWTVWIEVILPEEEEEEQEDEGDD